jgi:hypothetical protein
MIQLKFRNMKKYILLLTFIASSRVGSAQIYVDVDVATNGNGTSWRNAYNNLQDAVDAAAVNQEIWVAAGTYLPTASPDGTTTDPRDKAFHLGTNMKIYGGFVGIETQLSARNAAVNSTILSGDFSNNDIVTGGGSTLSFSNNNENAYHVMITADLTSASVIDGFTIEGANANGGSSTISYQSKTFRRDYGGGMYIVSSSPIITNSTFANNNADYGGGMLNRSSSSPTITNSTFTNNNATYQGGGMVNYDSSSTITNSTFTNNSASYGGGMVNYESSSTITNSTFTNNNASYHGGGMYNSSSLPAITNSTFTNNSASYGGGMSNEFSSPMITNSTFTNNNAAEGGGMDNYSSSPTITSSTFTNNYAAENGGGGMFNLFFSSPTITNSIFWDNIQEGTNNIAGADIFNSDETNTPTVTYCLTQANSMHSSGTGIVNNQNPLFVDAANGDYTLQICSPAIDAGDNGAWTTTGLSTDIVGNTRPFNSTVDMGAYEYQGIPIVITISASTFVLCNYKITHFDLILDYLT